MTCSHSLWLERALTVICLVSSFTTYSSNTGKGWTGSRKVPYPAFSLICRNLLLVACGHGRVSATVGEHQSHSHECEQDDRHDGRVHTCLGELANRLHDGWCRRRNVRVGELGPGSGGFKICYENRGKVLKGSPPSFFRIVQL